MPRSLLLALLLSPLSAENWPAWRGPTGVGVSNESGAPATFSKTTDVVWRLALPDRGNSTPIAWANRIFLTQALSKENRRTLMCVDLDSGTVLWQKGPTHSAPDPTHPTNPHASASPVTDGKLVIAWFGSAGLFAYDFEGKQIWHADLGAQTHTWGYGTSPVLDGDRVFLNFGPGARAFLVAVDKRTGKVLWQVNQPPGKGAKFGNWAPEDMYGTWSTPLVIRSEGRSELVVTLPHRVVAYDPSNGKELWSANGLGDLVYPSPVLGDGVVLAASGFSGPSMAIRHGGSGDVTTSHRLWHSPKSRQMIGSAVVRDGLFFTVDNGGIAQAADLKTGEVVWTGRLKGNGESNSVWSSPVLQSDRIWVMNQSGDVFVFKAAREFELLGMSSLGEPSNSSVVISGGSLILRTHEALWRIGRKSAQ